MLCEEAVIFALEEVQLPSVHIQDHGVELSGGLSRNLRGANIVDGFGRASAQVTEGHHEGLALHLALGVFSNLV